MNQHRAIERVECAALVVSNGPLGVGARLDVNVPRVAIGGRGNSLQNSLERVLLCAIVRSGVLPIDINAVVGELE